MRRILIISAAAVVASAPALTGRLGNASFAQSVPVTVPSQPTIADDHGAHPEPGDDHGGTASPRASASQASDDHGVHLEPGDDHGGTASPRASASQSCRRPRRAP